jgi:cell division transport system ATP-binding protein
VIRFSNVVKSYNGQAALSNINLHIKQGEIAFLTGHSGAGKTTLLKLIMMIERATKGQIFINGRDLSHCRRRHIPSLRRHIGMIFQNPQLLQQRTIFENVALPLIINNVPRYEIEKRVRAALDKVNLLNKEKELPAALSTGEQQRVGIARAVVNKPSILLADEPTGNLDPNLSKDIMHLFEAFSGVGVTVLIATHDLALIASLNHRMITLKKGEVIGGEAVCH